jgi:branched-chain amino acid transport system substrate-binding protein
MKRRLSLSLILLFTTGICLFTATCSLKKETIKIGAIIGLTGVTSNLVDVRDGMVLAVDEVNKWGGVNGREIELIVEDNKSDPEEAKKVFEKMESAYHPLLYISASSGVSLALAPLAKEHTVVLVGLVVTTPRLIQDNDWAFRYFSSEEDQTKTILFLLKELKVRKLGILYQDDELGHTLYEPLKAAFEKEGGIVKGESLDTDNPVLGDTVARLADADAIFIATFSNIGKTVIEEMKKSGYRGFIIGQSGFTSLLETDPGLDGVYVPAPILYKPDFAFAQELRKKYEARYDKVLTHHAAIGYDFIKLLAGLLEEKEISRESVRDLLSGGFTYPGVFGDITVKPGGHDITYPLYPARIINGGVEYLR